MILGIAVICAIRDKYTLVCIFGLNCVTMFCGLATEIYSRPALKTVNARPALKLGERRQLVVYDMELWQGQNRYRYSDPEQDLATKLKFFDARRWKNYLYRMMPHIFGIFPYSLAWYPIIDSFFHHIDDLCPRLEELMPDWVPLIIVGCFAIFSCFTFVQWRCDSPPARWRGCVPTRALCTRYQWTAPKHYWRTEVWYCILSVRAAERTRRGDSVPTRAAYVQATAKSFLGYTLLINVINKSSFNDAVSLVNSTVTTSFNETAFCLGIENFTSMRD